MSSGDAMEVEWVEDSQDGVAFSVPSPPRAGFFTITAPQPVLQDFRWSPKINMAPAVSATPVVTSPAVAPTSTRINFSKLGCFQKFWGLIKNGEKQMGQYLLNLVSLKRSFESPTPTLRRLNKLHVEWAGSEKQNGNTLKTAAKSKPTLPPGISPLLPDRQPASDSPNFERMDSQETLILGEEIPETEMDSQTPEMEVVPKNLDFSAQVEGEEQMEVETKDIKNDGAPSPTQVETPNPTQVEKKEPEIPEERVKKPETATVTGRKDKTAGGTRAKAKAKARSKKEVKQSENQRKKVHRLASARWHAKWVKKGVPRQEEEAKPADSKKPPPKKPRTKKDDKKMPKPKTKSSKMGRTNQTSERTRDSKKRDLRTVKAEFVKTFLDTYVSEEPETKRQRLLKAIAAWMGSEMRAKLMTKPGTQTLS